LKVLFFTRTDWGHCDCETDLYKYYPEKDSMEIIYSWSKRSEYARDKIGVIKQNGLKQLTKIAPLQGPIHPLYSFTWLSKEYEYGSAHNSTVENFPFQIEIGKTNFQYVQCLSKSINPRIKQYRIGENTNFILVTYKGDCSQGGMQDVLIICRKTNGILVSREVK